MSETTTDRQWSGGINPGRPVTCENCGKQYVPMGYELGPVRPCPHCGR